MAKGSDTNEAATPQVTTPSMAKKYKIKGGAETLSYPGFGYPVTKAHLEGPRAEVFIAAFKKLDAKANAKLADDQPKVNNFDKFIETV
jgi:hypothetical protein